MKYKNKDGIELSYEGHENNTHVNLVKEVVLKACKMIYGGAHTDAILFLKENFGLEVNYIKKH